MRIPLYTMAGENKPAMTYINEILIRRSDCDPLGHVRTSAYLSFLHESDLGTLEVA